MNSTVFKAVVRSEELLGWVRFPRTSATCNGNSRGIGSVRGGCDNVGTSRLERQREGWIAQQSTRFPRTSATVVLKKTDCLQSSTH